MNKNVTQFAKVLIVNLCDMFDSSKLILSDFFTVKILHYIVLGFYKISVQSLSRTIIVVHDKILV